MPISKEQYKELHTTARHHDLGLWAIPSVVFVIFFGIANLIIEEGVIQKNLLHGVVVGVAFLATLSLFFAFDKRYKRQKEIAELMNAYEVENGIKELELFPKKGDSAFCSAGWWMKWAMGIILLGYICAIVFIF